MVASPSRRGPWPSVGRYAILRRLGAGSMGTVYLARDGRSGREVALKVLRTDRLSPEAAGRLQEEFRSIAGLHHPRIATAFDFGWTARPALPFYTREFVDGEPLPPGPPAGASAAEWLRPILDLLDALDYLHAHGILHLDIHPGNLIVHRDPPRGSILIDFGLVRSPDGARRSTAAPGDLAGLPPELLGKGRPSAATDLFLAGRLLLYRLAGSAASEAGPPGGLPGLEARTSLEIERIVEKSLQPDPARRFRSAAEFRDVLAAVLGSPRRAGPQEPGEVTVGRERELARIDGLLRGALTGGAGILRPIGPPGSGKTRLLAEARMRAQILGLETVQASFFPDPGPGSPLVDALRAVGSDRKRRSRWLEPLDPSHGGAPEERARRAARALLEEDGKPLALLLDDLDRADRASAVLAEALIVECRERGRAQATRVRPGDAGQPGPSARGLAIIATSTAEPRAGKGEVLNLKPLGPADARRLLEVLARPLRIPERFLGKAAAPARGSPRRLRQIARALRATWGRAGSIPEEAEVPVLPPDSVAAAMEAIGGLSDLDRDAVAAAALLGRAAGAEELAAALAVDPARLRPRLAVLEKAEVLLAARRGRPPLYVLAGPPPRELAARFGEPERRRIHARLSAHLAGIPRPALRERENLARLRLLLGGPAGIDEARSVARSLRDAGLFDRAVGLLEEALGIEEDRRRRFALAEEASGILEEGGDHPKGIALLEPFYRKAKGGLPGAEGIRLRRRLGAHYHRSGRGDEALAIFEEAEALADPKRDAEELVFIDSELAELCNLRGWIERAEEACRRGFERLGALPKGNPFRARMELTLRASRGHLELRRMNLPAAREELRAALRMAGRSRMPAVQAVILNNLGIVENGLNLFPEAEGRFRAAERLLVRAGDLRPVVSIACNLAGLAAKRGSRDEALGHLERAAQIARRYPGRRIELFVESARGLVASILGDSAEAIAVLAGAVPLARQLGDRHLADFGQFYLAEARLACGRHREALRDLRAVLASAGKSGPPVLLRMAHSRLLLLAGLLGSPRLAASSRKALAGIPRTEALPEAWTDLAIGFAGILAGEARDGPIRDALEAFRALGVLAGERFARLGLLLAALAKGDRPAVEGRLAEMGGGPPETHRFLAVARPLAAAESLLFLGDDARAGEMLSEASGAIVGSPFLELDWRIELLRARLASRGGDLHAAREHLHRAVHVRDLLLQDLPARDRDRFLAHPRFAGLHELAARLERSPRSPSGVRPFLAGGAFEGMVGTSSPMVRVFGEIDRLRDQEVPVLISGETGTGKELVARALHRTGPRAAGPFFAVHCASLPEDLFEAEFFGHEPGAFTGAETAHPGLLETLRGGTLLLDEIGEMPAAVQAKLLRVLDSRRARRVGGTEERPVDVRFLASTGADLRARVRRGGFREDLYYRLGRIEIRLPPLRSRREDIEPLARHFLEVHARRLDRPAPVLEREALALLEAHSWPGNVRELEGVLLRAALSFSGPGSLGAEEIAPLLDRPDAAAPLLADEVLEGKSLDELHREVDRAYVLRLFRKTGGDPRKMMEALGFRPSYFYEWLKKIGIDIRSLRGG